MNTKGRLSLVLGAIFAVATGSVNAEMSYENGSGGSAKFYGHFNPAYLSFDDGSVTTDQLVDNASSNSRAGFWLDQSFGDNKLRFNFETSFGFRQSGSVSQLYTPPGFDWQKTDIRKIDLSYVVSFGTIFAGQGSMSTDGVAEYDLSGTTLATYVSIGDVAGSFLFRENSGALSGTEIGDVLKDLDGSRRMRVRYDTPSFTGITLSGAYGKEVLRSDDDNDYYDIALKYANTHGDVKVQAGMGGAWVAKPDNETSGRFMASASALYLPTGLNATVAGGSQGSDGGDYLYGKLGYIANFWAAGSTSISIDFYNGSNFSAEGTDSDTWGVGVVQELDDQNLELYAGYRNYSLSDNSGADYQDSQSFILGGRAKF